MLNYLRDLVKHTSGLDMDVLKITGDDDGNIQIEGMDTEKSIVLKGKFNKEIPELHGVCGLSNLTWLSGYVNLYREKTDDVSIIRKDQTYSIEVKNPDGSTLTGPDGSTVYEDIEENMIEELHFVRKSPRVKNSYRVVDRRMIPDQYNFVGADWDVVVKPTKQAIDMLAQQAAIGFESSFGVKTEDDILFLTFGDDGLLGEMEFATDIDGELSKPWIWDIGKVLTILKFADQAECTMSFLDKGALQITLNTGLGEYNYIMPAKAR